MFATMTTMHLLRSLHPIKLAASQIGRRDWHISCSNGKNCRSNNLIVCGYVYADKLLADWRGAQTLS